MADSEPATGRSCPSGPFLSWPGFSLTHEADLGIVRVQAYDALGSEATMRTLATKQPPPGRQVELGGGAALAWLAPGEWLLAGSSGQVTRHREAIEEGLGGSLALVTDLSDARVGFRLAGRAAVDRLASCCALDLRERSFPRGAATRSMLGGIGLFVARLADDDGSPCYRLIVDQTMAAHAARLLALP